MTKKDTIKYLELFAGVGGFRSAIERASKSAGISSKCIGFSEIDANALKTYRANFKLDGSELDIGDISLLADTRVVEALPNFDALFAGFPCQPFSLMGAKGGFADARGTLFFHIANIIKVKNPSLFILENVRGLKTHDGGRTFERIMEILTKELGYRVRAELLNSQEFGVPQTRRRLYFIGVRDPSVYEQLSQIDFKPTARRKRFLTTWHLLEKEVDDKYYLSQKMIKIILEHGSGNYWSKSEINRITARPLTATMHKMHRANQDNYYSEDFIHGEYDGSGIKFRSTGKQKIRKLTPLEAFRLQGFEDSFVKKAQRIGVSDTQLYKQAGNAITVNVAETVLSKLLKDTGYLYSLSD